MTIENDAMSSPIVQREPKIGEHPKAMSSPPNIATTSFETQMSKNNTQHQRVGLNDSGSGVQNGRTIGKAPSSSLASDIGDRVPPSNGNAPSQEVTGKQSRGRGAYDCGSPITGPVTFIDRRDLIRALSIQPNSTIDNGFVVPGVPTDMGTSIHRDKNDAETTMYYHLIGDPYKRDSTGSHATRLVVPMQLLNLVEGLHSKWPGRVGMESQIRKDLWDRCSKRASTQAASACWKEERAIEDSEDDEPRMCTEGSLWVKENYDSVYSQVGGGAYRFPGSPGSALRAWWRRPEATRGQNSAPYQTSNGSI